jgi:catechol 2,3-dioxygenase-like lactoylglutathione lyase family enzyme
MHVRRMRWLGIATERDEAMVAFLRDALGMRVAIEEPGTVELATAGGDTVQVFGPGHRYHAFFARHASGPVPLFEVDDLEAVRTAIERAGAEILGDVDDDDAWTWINVRAPDGNLYEFGAPRVV